MSDIYYIRELSSNNSEQIPYLISQCKKRDVDLKVEYLSSGGFILRIKEDDLYKLPHDDMGPYVGDDDNGYTIYKEV